MGNEKEVIRRLREELTEFSRRAFDRGLTGGSGGNMSVRVPDTDSVLVAPTGVSLADVDPDANLLVRLDGTVAENHHNLIPSKETGFHLVVYRLRPDAGAIAHVHPPYATAYANKEKHLPLVTVSSRIILKDVPWIECALPGSQELCDFVQEGITKHPDARVFLMKEHGILTVGTDIRSAYYLADLVEATAKTASIMENVKDPSPQADER